VKVERRWLVNAIREQLIPEFLQRGFVNVPLDSQGPTDRESLVAFPYGRLRRQRPNGYEFVEIQMAPYSRAAFRLNIGVAPPAGIMGVHGHIAAEDVCVGWLEEFYTLHSCPFFQTWFSISRWSRKPVTQDAYRSLVARVVGLIAEVENALAEGIKGPHVRHTRMFRSKS
jgi:hypothetical protein